MPSIFGESLFDDFFEDWNRPAKRPVKYSTPVTGIMKTDVKEQENNFVLDIELPGYKKEDVTAELKDGYMTITASRNTNTEEKDEDGKYIRRERFVGTTSRSFYVGEALKEEDIQAKFEDGVLHLFVPKKEAVPEVPETKYIQIG